jgi:hypothetical protein
MALHTQLRSPEEGPIDIDELPDIPVKQEHISDDEDWGDSELLATAETANDYGLTMAIARKYKEGAGERKISEVLGKVIRNMPEFRIDLVLPALFHGIANSNKVHYPSITNVALETTHMTLACAFENDEDDLLIRVKEFCYLVVLFDKVELKEPLEPQLKAKLETPPSRGVGVTTDFYDWLIYAAALKNGRRIADMDVYRGTSDYKTKSDRWQKRKAAGGKLQTRLWPELGKGFFFLMPTCWKPNTFSQKTPCEIGLVIEALQNAEYGDALVKLAHTFDAWVEAVVEQQPASMDTIGGETVYYEALLTAVNDPCFMSTLPKSTKADKFIKNLLNDLPFKFSNNTRTMLLKLPDGSVQDLSKRDLQRLFPGKWLNDNSSIQLGYRIFSFDKLPFSLNGAK